MRKIKNKIKTKNKTKRKQGFPVFLCAMLLVSSFPNTAFAEEIPEFTGTAESSFEDGSSLSLFGDGTGVQEEAGERVQEQISPSGFREDAGFTITNNTSSNETYTYEGGVLTVQNGADLTLFTSGQTSHRIVVAENAKATITLNGVHIVGGSATNEAAPVSAIDIADNASLLLKLADGSTNALIGGSDNISSNGVAGIHVPEETELVILGAGSLTVNGGASYSGFGGSGIGGNTPSGPNAKGENCGTVVILTTGELNISGGKEGNQFGNDIGGGKGPPNLEGDNGEGIRPTGDGNYVVWGEPILPNPPNNYTIPEGATLTVPSNAALCIPTGVTLTNHGTITGEGNLNGDGTLDGNGVVTVGTSNFQKNSALTLTIEGDFVSEKPIYLTAYGRPVTLKAKVEQSDIRTLSADDYNTVTFYVGTGDSKSKLGSAKVESNEASLSIEKITAENGWIIGQNTITAEFSGHSHLKPATGTATLTVGKGPQMIVPDNLDNVDDVTATSVTLKTVTDTGKVSEIEYGYTTDKTTVPIVWQSSPVFENLTPATAYDFYTRYAENDFYRPSASSSVGLKVVTAPAADAVTFDYINETIQYADTIEVSHDQNFGTTLQSGMNITSHIATQIYMRVKTQGDGDASLRGVATIEVPARPPSPSYPKVVNVSAAGQKDGKILNLTPNADYQTSTDNQNLTEHKTDANGVISNLAAGTYWVRTKATPTQFAGASDNVTIGVGNIITIILPTFEPVYVGYDRYDQPDPKPIKIHNSSDEEVTLTGLYHTAGETFIVQSVDQNYTVPAGGSNTNFTVQPGENLGVGEHTATITAEYGNGQIVNATVHFTVLPRPVPPPTIESVLVSPKQLTLEKGSSQQFTAEVEGTGSYNKEVIWSVSGQTSSQTVIGEDGILTVGKDENASVLTVIAAAAGDGEKSDTAIVTVVDPPIPAVEISEVVIKGNQARVFLSGEAEGAAGYDFVIGKDRDCIQTKEYYKVNKNVLTTDTTFYYVEQGTYYAYCHAWRRVDGKKEFGGWSAPYEFTVESVTPEQPKITRIRVSKKTIKITYTRSEGATGYDLVLGKAVKKVNGELRPVDYGELVKKVYNGNTVTATFKNVEKGTYYAGLHAYNRTSEDGKKVFSPWSKAKKIRVK